MSPDGKRRQRRVVVGLSLVGTLLGCAAWVRSFWRADSVAVGRYSAMVDGRVTSWNLAGWSERGGVRLAGTWVEYRNMKPFSEKPLRFPQPIELKHYSRPSEQYPVANRNFKPRAVLGFSV